MNRRWLSLAVLVSAVLVGCGGVEPEPVSESLKSTSQELVTCSTYCEWEGVTKSCTGNTCSARQNDWVGCDGQYQYCAWEPLCEGDICDAMHGTACSPDRARAPCCYANFGGQGGCFCSGGTWTCTL
ncbi:hypothetical protein [Hyalangium gracile]|uniref:hypothetical protein n=1 Tax=Hyalangium gracile TaxID=394092 RepID=UPI001CC9E609|nr:hypothetical protein [Hyalangium gracile]